MTSSFSGRLPLFPHEKNYGRLSWVRHKRDTLEKGGRWLPLCGAVTRQSLAIEQNTDKVSQLRISRAQTAAETPGPHVPLHLNAWMAIRGSGWPLLSRHARMLYIGPRVSPYTMDCAVLASGPESVINKRIHHTCIVDRTMGTRHHMD